MPSLRDRSTRKMIRLAYHGCANRPFYHFVVQLNRAPRNQKPIEQIGTYDPLPNVHKERLVAIDFDRLKYWYAYRGASLSKPVLQLLGLCGYLPIHYTTRLDAHRMGKIKAAIAAKKEAAEKAAEKEQKAEENNT